VVKPVDSLVADFAKAGANIITFHPEAKQHVHRTIGLIHDCGCKAGTAFNPATSLQWLDHVMENIDLVLIMSVNPGFGGQAFITRALVKLAEARQRIRAPISGWRSIAVSRQGMRTRSLAMGPTHSSRYGDLRGRELRSRDRGAAHRDRAAQRTGRCHGLLNASAPVAFDVDGTLVDSASDLAASTNAMLDELGYDSPYRRMEGQPC
jgi:hypothetical protein